MNATGSGVAPCTGAYRFSIQKTAGYYLCRRFEAHTLSAQLVALTPSLGNCRSGEHLTNHYHAAVWIDHHEARVFHFNATDVDEIVVHPEHPTRHIHHKANSIGSGHTSEDHAFFQDVISAIGTASAILVTGPANAKTELIKHIHRHNPQLIERIAAVETVDHPTDGAFVAHARRYFRAADRMSAQRP